MNVLFIDDDRIVLSLITCLLPEDLFQVQTASSVAQAWELLSHDKPDVICCDLIMPGATGLDFLAQRQQHPELTDIPIILLSGTNEQVLLDQATTLGATANLTKPFSRNELITLLQKVA